MEENSARWLAVREASRRILVEENLILNIPQNQLPSWQRLILNMADSMPQRLVFPEIAIGPFSINKDGKEVFDFHPDEPSNASVLWLPFEVEELIGDLIQMCSELLLAGYPGCSGCGYQDEEENWDELAHRKRLANLRNRSR